MTTYAVLIGNSDDKLPQREWAVFVRSVEEVIDSLSDGVEFMGFSPTDAQYQNACWVFRAGANKIDAICLVLEREAARFRQDSIALVTGDTDFIKAVAS